MLHNKRVESVFWSCKKQSSAKNFGRSSTIQIPWNRKYIMAIWPRPLRKMNSSAARRPLKNILSFVPTFSARSMILDKGLVAQCRCLFTYTIHIIEALRHYNLLENQANNWLAIRFHQSRCSLGMRMFHHKILANAYYLPRIRLEFYLHFLQEHRSPCQPELL